jgi:hypothetical protein
MSSQKNILLLSGIIILCDKNQFSAWESADRLAISHKMISFLPQKALEMETGKTLSAARILSPIPAFIELSEINIRQFSDSNICGITSLIHHANIANADRRRKRRACLNTKIQSLK